MQKLQVLTVHPNSEQNKYTSSLLTQCRRSFTPLRLQSDPAPALTRETAWSR